jgi:hypothetical protein
MIAFVLALGLAACSGETSGDSTVADDATLAAESSEGAGEHAEGTVAREGGDEGEHTEGGEEARESGEGEGEHGDRERGEGGEGEHGEEGGHDEEGGEGEESGIYVARGDTWDAVRRGARLVLAFNAASGAFEGTVHNTTNGTLCAVRVEVHLGDGPELGPTARTDVPAGGSTSVTLSAAGESFERWTAHPELSACQG